MHTALALALKQTMAIAGPRMAAAVAAPLQVALLSTTTQENVSSVLFHKQDEKEMRKLLQKMYLQACMHDKAGFKQHVEHDKKTLAHIPGLVPGVNLNQEQVEALLNWKHLH